MAKHDRAVLIACARRDSKLRRLKSTDVVIIGSGFSGLEMAKEITSKSALNVVVLERGPARSPSKYVEEMNDIAILRVGLKQNPAEQTYTLRNSNRQSFPCGC